MILQRQISEEQLRAISRMRSFNRAFRSTNWTTICPSCR
ncbi:flagellar glycosyl transferase, FgtA domain protein [Pseudomonas aeruginosa]|nr:flagellar glycosyl transferase, FgtA domain protein [Pseudomonas aeruginosa]